MLTKISIDFSKPLALTEAELKELNELDNYPITFDEDSMPLTEEQMRNHFAKRLKEKGYYKDTVK